MGMPPVPGEPLRWLAVRLGGCEAHGIVLEWRNVPQIGGRVYIVAQAARMEPHGRDTALARQRLVADQAALTEGERQRIHWSQEQPIGAALVPVGRQRRQRTTVGRR